MPGRWKTLEKPRAKISTSSAKNRGQEDSVNDLNSSLEAVRLKSDKNHTATISNDIPMTSLENETRRGRQSNENFEEKEQNWQYPSRQKSPDPPRPQSPHSPTRSTSRDLESSATSPSSGEQYYCQVHGCYHTRSSGGSARYGPSTSKLLPDSNLAAGLEVTNPNYRLVQLSRPSLTGLCNLGNSCFMNSILQSLSNTRLVRDYFVNGRHLADINRDNPLGFKGELAKAFSFLIRKLWSGEYEYFAPKKLLSVIVSKSNHFGDNEQHDSHEFMSYLLDGLHEDLNRIRKKPQTSPVESDDRSDAEVAEEAWRVYKMRNDSFFVDLFQGQFKSTLVCAVCSKVYISPYVGIIVFVIGQLYVHV